MNTSQTGLLSEILEGGKLSNATLGYFRQRLRNRLHQFILREFIARQREGLTQADVARILGRRPEQIHRWLGSPGNWTSDTVSDLLLAISKAELQPSAHKIAERPVRNHRFPDWINSNDRPRSTVEDARREAKPAIPETRPQREIVRDSTRARVVAEAT